ncbi:unnamed protein product [Nippostrongylus brasiliensis]|uniref:N-acetyltransferase domain-containing protein n=1 Tax=Nippostrongylus brasiliensis TaxID=27835 RepID=A0A0N4Y7X1_NIPBR|nr:unnamed protein product [Nippostrongylus brasiliensis]
MLRRSPSQIRSYSQKVDPSKAYNFLPAKTTNFDEIVNLCVDEFIRVEPHCRGSDKLIGFRLMSIGYRDHSLEVEPIPYVEPNEAGMKRIMKILDESKAKMWQWADPGVQKMVRREVTYVSPRHQRKGIAQHLLHLGLDFNALRASSLANQTLLSKNGYTCVSKPNYKLDMHDGNEGIKVFFKDLRK